MTEPTLEVIHHILTGDPLKNELGLVQKVEIIYGPFERHRVHIDDLVQFWSEEQDDFEEAWYRFKALRAVINKSLQQVFVGLLLAGFALFLQSIGQDWIIQWIK